MMASPPTSYGSSWSPPPIVLQLICGNRGAWRIAVSAAWEIHSDVWLAVSPPHCAAAHRVAGGGAGGSHRSAMQNGSGSSSSLQRLIPRRRRRRPSATAARRRRARRRFWRRGKAKPACRARAHSGIVRPLWHLQHAGLAAARRACAAKAAGLSAFRTDRRDSALLSAALRALDSSRAATAKAGTLFACRLFLSRRRQKRRLGGFGSRDKQGRAGGSGPQLTLRTAASRTLHPRR